MNYIIKKFSAQFDISKFNCGVAYLNDWLRQYAGQTERRSEARTYLAIDSTSNEVAGFYSLLVTEVHRTGSNSGKARRLPAVLIANLAVDTKFQGCGLGAQLVVDAIVKSLYASEVVGVSVIVVDLFEIELASFYERFGFKVLGDGSTRMALPAEKARKILIDL